MFGGIGFVFSEGGGFFVRCVKRIGQFLLTRGTWFSDVLIFQNPDDCRIFEQKGLLKNQQYLIVNGSGVNLREFSPELTDPLKTEKIRKEFGIDDDGILVLMISRVTRNKGVLEYVAASERFAEMAGKIRFVHVGPFETDSLEGISEKQLPETPSFHYAGYRNDIKNIIAAADIVALPSYHREGIPNVLLEAMAMEKPIITTDNVGCREVVEDGVNGYCIPVRDEETLAEAVRKLAENPESRKSMGRAGRDIVEKRFTVESVNQAIMEKAFELTNDRIPEFFVEEGNGFIFVSLNGEISRHAVTAIEKDHVLNETKTRKRPLRCHDDNCISDHRI